MVRTIQDIKNECIALDISNLGSIGTTIDGKWYDFKTAKEIELFYEKMSLKELLHTYSQYNGIKDYNKENPSDRYTIDLMDVLENL
jgi:hypothetical protein